MNRRELLKGVITLGAMPNNLKKSKSTTMRSKQLKLLKLENVRVGGKIRARSGTPGAPWNWNNFTPSVS